MTAKGETKGISAEQHAANKAATKARQAVRRTKVGKPGTLLDGLIADQRLAEEQRLAQRAATAAKEQQFRADQVAIAKSHPAFTDLEPESLVHTIALRAFDVFVVTDQRVIRDSGFKRTAYALDVAVGELPEDQQRRHKALAKAKDVVYKTLITAHEQLRNPASGTSEPAATTEVAQDVEPAAAVA